MKVSVNGVEVFVGQGGMAWKPAQRTLVLQHGAGMDRTVWVLLARYFSRHGFNVVCADLPGHGASGGQALDTIEAQAAHIWHLLDELRVSHGLPEGQCILGGHSMGALVALEAASQRSESVQQLVLLGSGYPMPVGQALLDAARENRQEAVDMIAVFGHSFSSQLGHNPVAGISVQNVAMAMLERANPGVLFTDLQACNNYQAGESAAQTVAGLPCTLISGEHDRMTPPRSSRALAELLNSRFETINNCGHMMMSEQPEVTLQLLRQCLV